MNKLSKVTALSVLAAALVSGCRDPVVSTDMAAPIPGTGIVFPMTTDTSAQVAWGVATDETTTTEALEYKLVRAASAAAIDTVAEVDVISGGAVVMDWTTAAVSKAVTGLSPSTTYYFAAIVRDAVGNKSLYSPQSVSTSAPLDTTAPTPGTEVTFSETGMTSTKVAWGAATDDVTGAGALAYRLVRAASAAAIDTVAEADAVAGTALAMDWTAGATSATAFDLEPDTLYYFAVAVRDAAGNKALYGPRVVTTAADTVAPTTGTGITFSGTSSTSTTVGWGKATDGVTAQAALEYKLVVATSSAFIDTIAEANGATIENGRIVMDWTADASGCAATSLSASSYYYFAVLVRDAAGNLALYAPVYVLTAAAPDTTAPTVGTAISFSGTSSSSTTVQWGAASDNVTAAASLNYKLVRAPNAAAIDTVAEADAVTGAALAMDWTAGATSKTAAGLSSSTTYYFAVLVRDAAGNESLYSPASVITGATADTTAPTVGTAISFSGTSSSSTTVQWGAASDDVTAAASLQYKLVRASNAAAIDTVAEADAVTGAALAMGWTAGATSKTAAGLSPTTTYYFAVLVRDAAGNETLYAPQSVTTAVLANLSFDLATDPGWTCTGEWEWGTVSGVGPVGAVCYGTVIDGNYSDNLSWATDYVQLGPLDLSGFATASGFKLTFDAWFKLDFSYDFAGLQYSTDGTTFTTVPAAYVSGYAYNSTTASCLLSWSPNPTSSPPAWRTVVIDLGGLGLNGQSTVYFRWVLSSDESVTDAGFYIDNIVIGY